MQIRKAKRKDLSRIAEIYVFNNRLFYFPIFRDERFSFGQLQVVSAIRKIFSRRKTRKCLFVCEDTVIKGFLEQNGSEIRKCYVDPCFQDQGVGGALLEFAIEKFEANRVWVLEKNERALAFYARFGFRPTGERQPEGSTGVFSIALERLPYKTTGNSR